MPVRDLRSLSVWWALPPLHPLYRSKPHRILSHLIGHEGEGSLLSLLKSKGWCDALSAGETNSNSDFALFEVRMDPSPNPNPNPHPHPSPHPNPNPNPNPNPISNRDQVQMDLSPQGDAHVDEMLALTFQYLAMLRASVPLPP